MRPDESADELTDRAWKLLGEEDYEDARHLARECIGRDPTALDCHRILTYSFSRAGDYGPEHDQAIDDCLALLPSEPYCLEVKVLAEVHAKRIASAKQWLAKREALDDQPPDYLGRALIAEAEGDLPAACEAYRGACRFSQPYACRIVDGVCERAEKARHAAAAPSSSDPAKPAPRRRAEHVPSRGHEAPRDSGPAPQQCATARRSP